MELIIITKDEVRSLFQEEFRRLVPPPLQRTETLPDASHGFGWVSNARAMDIMDLSRSTLQRFRDSGLLPYSKVNKSIYYRIEDLESILVDRKRSK